MTGRGAKSESRKICPTVSEERTLKKMVRGRGFEPLIPTHPSDLFIFSAIRHLWTFPGQTHLNFYAQEFEQVAVIPTGILLFAFDAAFLGLLAF